MLTYILLGIGLSMDSMAVSVSNGISHGKMKLSTAAKNSFVFAVFQALMPLLGWFAGQSIETMVKRLDHWIAFAILFYLGVKMIIESKEADKPLEKVSYKKLFSQAFATSIDAFAVGISLAILQTEIIEPLVIIGVVTFIFSFAGHIFGGRITKFNNGKIELLGGLILIGIGLKILIEHLITHS